MNEDKTMHVEQRAFAGDVAAALEEARRVLGALAFRIEDEGERSLRAAGPGLTNSNQPGLNFSKRLEVEVHSGRLFVRADRAALKRLLNILLWVPTGLAVLVLSILLMVFASQGKDIPWLPVVVPAVFGPLVIVGIQIPIFRRVFGRKADRAQAAFADQLVLAGDKLPVAG